VLKHDVAVTGVTAPAQVIEGDNATISVDVTNPGDFEETFNVSITYDTTPIRTESITLASQNSTTILFAWNTTEVTPNTYTITAEAVLGTDEDLTNNSASTSITINPKIGPPVASFTFSPSGPIISQTVTFNASASYDLDETIVSYFWNFGDETNSTGEIVEHAYPTAGTYTIILTVTDNDTLIDSTSANVTISPPIQPPVASFTYSSTKPDIDEDVMFNATVSSDSDGYIVGYFWDFGDEETADETVPYVYHAYDEGGTYAVKLTVTDNAGWNGSVTHEVAIRYVHDIMVVSVSESHNTATVGDSVTITVIVGNVGSEDEGGFDVNVYYDSTVAAPSQTVTTLASDQNQTLTFSWDTADVAEDTYRIKAVASSVSGETYTEDNTELGGTVTVTAAGEFPWLYVGIGAAIVVVLAGAALYFMKRKG